MKGATPSGPIAFVNISATREHGGLAGDRQAREPDMIAYGTRAGRYCEPIPAAIASEDAGRDERRGLSPSA